ncbi:MAG: Flp pilus assembly protein CpaB [Actinobacteria bacterium]|nr:Flp pilus assembly protein CpaB [Actinomycetota bacterium]
MKIKALIPMLVGVGIGLLALKMGWGYIEQQRLSVAASQGDTPIVIAKFDISPGTQLKLSDFTTVDWPRSTVPRQSYADPEKLVGRVNSTQLIAQLPVLENMLAPPGTGPGLPALVPQEYQAMTVKVDEFAGVGGFIKPGDTVDVVATFSVKRTEAGNTETVTRTILRGISVCAVGQQVQPDENNEPMVVRSVTLLVKPLQAQKLSLAATRGTIALALRSGQGPSSAENLSAISFSELLRSETDQTTQSKTTGEWVSNLLQSNKPDQTKTVPVKIDPRWEMKIYRGPAVQELIFESATSSRRLQASSAESRDKSTTKLGFDPNDWNEQDPENFNKIQGQNSWSDSSELKNIKDDFPGE